MYICIVRLFSAPSLYRALSKHRETSDLHLPQDHQQGLSRQLIIVSALATSLGPPLAKPQSRYLLIIKPPSLRSAVHIEKGRFVRFKPKGGLATVTATTRLW